MSVLFPNVPKLPGVPQLARAAAFVDLILPVIGRSAPANLLWKSSQGAPAWGILDDTGAAVLVPDSFLSFGNRTESRISDFPVQEQSFASYNKVILPSETSIRVTKGGTLSDREEFLNTLDNIAGDLNLYSILTPERTYLNVNIMRTEVIRRGPQGAYFLAEVDIYFREIKQVSDQVSADSVPTANAQNPAAVPPVNQGLVQSKSLASSVASNFNSLKQFWQGLPNVI